MFNYDKIGGKIKGLARGTFIVETIATVITGLLLFVNGITAGEGGFAILGLLSAVCGPLIAWVSTWILYGFGELIDKICDIERNTRLDKVKSKAQSKLDTNRIERIENLRSQGLITEEEYRAAIYKNN